MPTTVGSTYTVLYELVECEWQDILYICNHKVPWVATLAWRGWRSQRDDGWKLKGKALSVRSASCSWELVESPYEVCGVHGARSKPETMTQTHRRWQAARLMRTAVPISTLNALFATLNS